MGKQQHHRKDHGEVLLAPHVYVWFTPDADRILYSF
jgi:hypothetical protein